MLPLCSHNFYALGCSCTVELHSADRADARRLSELVQSETERIERKFSRYLSDSIVSRINRSAAGDPLEVDEETAGLLHYAEQAYRQSDGLFDVTSGVLRRCWDFRSGRLPAAQDVKELLGLVDWRLVEWKNPWVRLARVGMELDFGGIGKEYAVDRAAALLLENGARYGMINFGGDVRVIGPHPDGSPWLVGIADPDNPAAACDRIAVQRGAVATSGDYERYMVVDGQRYCHILNPRTGFPVQGVRSVSVVHQSCLVAGTLSTTAMLLGPKRAERFLKAQGVPYKVIV